MQIFKRIFNYLKDPHGKRVQELKDHYRELDELSNIAVEIGDVNAYRSLQIEMRQVFFEYLTASVVDTIYRLAPYVIIICLISIKWKTVTVPLINWEIATFGAFLLGYLVSLLGRWMFSYIKSNIGVKFNNLSMAKVQENK